MSEYSGNIRDLPVVTGGHFIENSTKKMSSGLTAGSGTTM